MGRFAEAEATQLEVLTIFETAYGPHHLEVAVTLTHLGLIKQELGSLNEAKPLVSRAAEIFTAAYGADHPHTRQAIDALESFG